MQTNLSNQDNSLQQQEIPPAEVSILCSLNTSSADPGSLPTENKSSSINNNVVANDGGDKANGVGGGTIGDGDDGENLNAMMTKPLLVDTSGDDVDNNDNALKELLFDENAPKCISMRRLSFPRDTPENNNRRNTMGQLFYKSGNNNYEEDLIMTESKTALLDKICLYDNDDDWKRDRWDYDDFVYDLQARFPWKRIAYIAVLLVLGVTCAILAVMKLCGGADWMNTATFSVIIMGTVMLLPPGLYYGRILICITCRCKGYTLWDVPAGPFG